MLCLTVASQRADETGWIESRRVRQRPERCHRKRTEEEVLEKRAGAKRCLKLSPVLNPGLFTEGF